jgi:hypothetical protein
MTPEAQRIAIAKAHGYTWLSNPIRTRTPSGAEGSYDIPDYLNDLNAMHEAEKTLDPLHPYKAPWLFYRTAILDLAGDQNQHATASQKAEAFLRALNLWTE